MIEYNVNCNGLRAFKTLFDDVRIIIPDKFNDERGFFFESINTRNLWYALDNQKEFVQENHSYSRKNVIRGIHYQIEHPQGKFIRVVNGKILDVIVDLRKYSNTFGQHISIEVSSENNYHVWIPPGFGHGFSVLSDEAYLVYSVTDYRFPEHERTIKFNDSTLNIDWKLYMNSAIVSLNDYEGKLFTESEYYK